MSSNYPKVFFWYLFGIVATTPIIGHMFVRTWSRGANEFFINLTVLPFIPDGVAGVKVIVIFFFGLYCGFLILFMNAEEKNAQGFLIAVGTIIVISILAKFDLGLPNMRATQSNVSAFLIGFVLGVAAEGFELNSELKGELLDIDLSSSSAGRMVKERGGLATFPIASRGLILMIVLLVVVGNVGHLIFTGISAESFGYAVLYIIASGALLYSMDQFIDLDIEIEQNVRWLPNDVGLGSNQDDVYFEVLGPKKCGKTNFAFGLYLEVIDDSEFLLNRSSDDMKELQKEYNEMTTNAIISDKEAGESKHTLDWIGTTTRDRLMDLWFEFTVDNSFNKNVRVDMLDHGGEYFQEIGNELSDVGVRTDGGRWDDDESDDSAEDSTDSEPDQGLSETTEFSQDKIDDDEITKDIDDRPAPPSEPTSSTEDILEDVGASNSSVNSETDEGSTDVENLNGQDTLDDINNSKSTEENVGNTREVTATSDIQNDNDGGSPNIASKLARNIKNSEKLVFLIDCERFFGKSPTEAGDAHMEITHFMKIADEVENKEIILVASKADYFIDDWKQEKGNDYQPHERDGGVNSFRTYIENQLKTNRQIKGLVQIVNAPTIHPVYFATERRNGELAPKPDQNGNFQPVGFKRVLETVVKG